jgi:CubicO group peptidase (beta-lactamase class C family)
MGQTAMGYVVLLQGSAGTIIAEANYGYARTPCEAAGAQPYTRETQTAWGSVTKMLTTAAVIDKTERSVRRLEETMHEFLPKRWRPEVHADHRVVTIRHLLSYQSGFAQKAPEGVYKEDLLERLRRPAEKPVGSRAYSNESFSIFHYMGRYFREAYWDDLDDSYRPGEIDYDSYVRGHSLAIYKETLRERIYEPLQIKGSCNQADHAGKNYANYYNSSSSTKGYFMNPQDHDGCTTGGIVMSAKDMGKFLHALTRTDKVVSDENRKTLLAVPTKDVLGWNGHRAVADGDAFYKAGARNPSGNSIPGNTASGHAGAYIVAFPNGMSAVIAINSNRPENAKGLLTILLDGYNAGLGK